MEWGVYGENVYLDEKRLFGGRKTFVSWVKIFYLVKEQLFVCEELTWGGRHKKNIYLVGEGVHVWFLGN